MNRLILSAILATSVFNLKAQETIRIPDIALEEALVDLKIDTNGLNGTILASDAKYVVNLNVSDPIENPDLPNVYSKIKDLTGIEHFPNLKRLDCFGNNITKVDLSKNKELTFVNLSGNKITSLDVSNNPKLRFLSCDENQLNTLILGDKNELNELYCNSNQLTNLDLSTCSSLSVIDASKNSLTEIKIHKNSSTKDWYKDTNTNFVTEFETSTDKTVNKAKTSTITSNHKKPLEVSKNYDENFQKDVVQHFEKLVLNDNYIKEKLNEIKEKYNLNERELNKWLNKHSKILEIKKRI